MRYAAFISYNHRDRKWASWLHRQIETFRIPKSLHGRESPLGTLKSRLPPVFQDREELASSADLAQSVRDALEQSQTLIVICSPDAVASRWVNEEIRTFRSMGRGAHIKCLIVGGEPHASRNAELDPKFECFPAALLEGGNEEPLAADVRPRMDSKQAAKLKLIAGLIGVGYDDLRQREATRRQRNVAMLAAISFAGFVVMSALTLFALIQRNEAVAQRDIARKKTLTAERTVDFVKSLFIVADPSEAKGAEITAREVLDRGVKQIAGSLSNEPEVKADLTTTLSEVYGGLGLLKQSNALALESGMIDGLSAPARARSLVALGDSERRMAKFHDSIATYKQALKLLNANTDEQILLRARILSNMGTAHSFLDEPAFGKAMASESLRIVEKQQGGDTADAALAHEVIGANEIVGGNLDAAKRQFARAVAIRAGVQGNLHPGVTENLNQLGSIEYLQNNPAAAERYYRQVLANDTTVLGDKHPDTALTLNNLGRVLLEQRKFADANNILERAIAINLTQRDEASFNMAFPYSNLALAKHGLGTLGAAEPLFRKALVAARANKHRTLAPILTDLADLLCENGQTGEGLAMLDEARPIMVKTYPKDAWRVAWTDMVRGSCLLKAGRRSEGAAMIRGNAKAVQSRWPPGSLYGHIAAERIKRVN
jgi:tetratricopeptide (TPR) repeat protein